MNDNAQTPVANCPKCKNTKLIDHNGGKWCALCGEFAGDFVQVVCQKSDAERTARFLSAHEDNRQRPNPLRCSSCLQPVDIGDSAYDDGEWLCGACIARYA